MDHEAGLIGELADDLDGVGGGVGDARAVVDAVQACLGCEEWFAEKMLETTSKPTKCPISET